MREEVNELIKQLVDLERVEEDEGFGPLKTVHFPSEDDHLGFSKFSSPNFLLANKRSESQRYMDQVKDEISKDLFKSEEYLESRKWLQYDDQPPAKSENCQCLRDFYSQHSTCS